MRRLIRPVASFLALVLIQLVLVESGYACRMPMDGAAGGSEMAGMRMAGGADPSPSAPTGPHGDETACRFPWAPNGCQAMAPCPLSAIAVTPPAFGSLAQVRVAPLRVVLLAPPARTLAPELPPPRA